MAKWTGKDLNLRRRKASRFTVCPLWPLGYPSVKNLGNGADRGIRTHDLRFTKPLLYQLSYVGTRTPARGPACGSDYSHKTQTVKKPPVPVVHGICEIQMSARAG